MSQRQAPLSQKSAKDSGHCLGCARMMVRYRSRKSNDAELRTRLRGLTHKRRRFGYRGLHVLLKRQGDAVNTSAWRSSPTPRSRTSGSPTSSIGSSASAASPSRSQATSDQQCHPATGGRLHGRLALHRAGQAGAERFAAPFISPPRIRLRPEVLPSISPPG